MMGPFKIRETNKQVSRAQTKKPPTTPGSLGIVGFCHKRIPNLGLTAKPLDHTLKGADSELLVWMGYCQRASLVAQMVKNLPAMQETWVGKIPWRREWQSNPVFLPGEFHGQRSLAGYSPGVPKNRTRLSDYHTYYQKAYKTLKLKLTTAPVLGLPDLQNEFKLYVHERQGMALGILIQLVGDIPWPVAYLSKQLDTTAASWPPCLQAVATTCELQKGSLCPYC